MLVFQKPAKYYEKEVKYEVCGVTSFGSNSCLDIVPTAFTEVSDYAEFIRNPTLGSRLDTISKEVKDQYSQHGLRGQMIAENVADETQSEMADEHKK